MALILGNTVSFFEAGQPLGRFTYSGSMQVIISRFLCGLVNLRRVASLHYKADYGGGVANDCIIRNPALIAFIALITAHGVKQCDVFAWYADVIEPFIDQHSIGN